MYFKDPFESKYQLLINGKENMWIKNLKNPKAFMEYSQTTDDVYEKNSNPTTKRKVLIVLDDMIADTEANKTLCLIVTELFLRKKLDISLAFISQNYKTKRNSLFYYENT